MIDTIQLTTNDFEFDSIKNGQSKNPFKVDKKSESLNLNEDNENHTILIDSNNRELKGVRIHNTQPLRDTAIIQISNMSFQKGVSVPCLSVRLSAPKYLNGLNNYTATFSDVVRLEKELSKDLEDLGIKTNLKNANIARLDITTNTETKYPMSYYLPIIKRAETKKLKSREYGQSTLLLGNQTRQLCLYDKLDCMNEHQETIPTEWQGLNILRTEYRTLKYQANKKQGFSNFSDLLSHEQYEQTKEIHKKRVREFLFNNRDSMTAEHATDIYQIFQTEFQSAEKINKDTISKAIIKCAVAKVGDIVAEMSLAETELLFLYEQIQIRKGVNPSVVKVQKNRIKKTFEDFLFSAKENASLNTIQISDLWNELYEKLCA